MTWIKHILIATALSLSSLSVSGTDAPISPRTSAKLEQIKLPSFIAEAPKRSENLDEPKKPKDPGDKSCLDVCDDELDTCKKEGKSILVCSTAHQKCVLACDEL
ncbi:hypothetical protein SAMN05216299_1274 [Nitrosospira sp. Nsp14]|uniref:hypothetical protein n=1 Tax=Nitrosospira sp. Nsp14 TaxID=1855333 RepID=UPI0008E4AB6B|nr:hypothetical protein [Nitrosospira sp. Nsp14]SFH58603.1 hypothetical protein SAMN05216299_1274 [Nitrosospira sp. Nsp14]